MFEIRFHHLRCRRLDFFLHDRFHFYTLASVRTQESERSGHRKSNTFSRGFVGVMKTRTCTHTYIYMNRTRAIFIRISFEEFIRKAHDKHVEMDCGLTEDDRVINSKPITL